MKTKRKSGTGIQSVEVGFRLIEVMTSAKSAMTLTALANATGMTASKAHKYLTSFVRLGLVSQIAETGRYDLGPLSLEIGFSSLRRLNGYEFAQDSLNELRDRLDLTAAFTVWSNRGPTIVRRAENNQQAVGLMVQLGFVLPVLTSANGRVFAAYLDRRLTQAHIDAELADPRGDAAVAGLKTNTDVDALLATVRKQGVGYVAGTVHPALISVCAPVFDHDNKVVAGINVTAQLGFVDLSPHSRAAEAVKEAAKALSYRLGALK